MPGTLSTITSVFPPEGRAKAVGVWPGSREPGILGMLVGGALARTWWWGSIFVVSSVLAVVALIATLAHGARNAARASTSPRPRWAPPSRARHRRSRPRHHEGPSRGWSDPVTIAGIIGGIVAGVPVRRLGATRTARCSIPGCSSSAASRPGRTSLFLQFFAIFRSSSSPAGTPAGARLRSNRMQIADADCSGGDAHTKLRYCMR